MAQRKFAPTGLSAGQYQTTTLAALVRAHAAGRTRMGAIGTGPGDESPERTTIRLRGATLAFFPLGSLQADDDGRIRMAVGPFARYPSGFTYGNCGPDELVDVTGVELREDEVLDAPGRAYCWADLNLLVPEPAC